MAQSAFWAWWADAMPMISERLPEVANRVELQLAMEEPVRSLGELQEAAQSLDRCGFAARPSWAALRGGARPLLCLNSEPGEWQHGSQFHASSISEHHFRETMVLRQSCAADQAHLRSHSGPGSSDVLMGGPLDPSLSFAHSSSAPWCWSGFASRCKW